MKTAKCDAGADQRPARSDGRLEVRFDGGHGGRIDVGLGGTLKRVKDSHFRDETIRNPAVRMSWTPNQDLLG